MQGNQTNNNAARQVLRGATRNHHLAVDEVFSAFDLTNQHGYGLFLQAHGDVVLPIENLINQVGLESVLADWPKRRRSISLLSDLAVMSLNVSPTHSAIKLASISQALGAAYVLEGSRLGGAVLAARVPSSLPTSYLRSASIAKWPDFLNQLDMELDTAAKLAEAVIAAEATFRLFETAGRQQFQRTLR